MKQYIGMDKGKFGNNKFSTIVSFEESRTMSEIKFEIIKKIGVLSKTASGWAKVPPLSFGRVGVGTIEMRCTTSMNGARMARRWARG
jgi:hypothetical protein